MARSISPYSGVHLDEPSWPYFIFQKGRKDMAEQDSFDFSDTTFSVLDCWVPMSEESCISRTLYIAERNARNDEATTLVARLQQVQSPTLEKLDVILAGVCTPLSREIRRELEEDLAAFHAREAVEGVVFEVIVVAEALEVWDFQASNPIPLTTGTHRMKVRRVPDSIDPGIVKSWFMEDGQDIGAPCVGFYRAETRGALQLRQI